LLSKASQALKQREKPKGSNKAYKELQNHVTDQYWFWKIFRLVNEKLRMKVYSYTEVMHQFKKKENNHLELSESDKIVLVGCGR